MANGYIGKISAVVTANTSDLSRRLAAAQGDFNKFANRLELSIGAASRKAGDSIDSIFTRYQRLERSLRSALEINLRSDREIKNIQQLVSVAEQINRPLAAAASQAERLGLGVQGAFLPALRAAQSEAESLSESLRNGGLISERAFSGVEGVVNRTTQAIQRLAQAQQLASQSFTGNELQFGNPRLFEALSAGARTTQRAAALPAPALVDGDIARQIRALEQYKDAAIEADARVSALRLDPTVNPEVLIAAERRLESLVETYSRAGAQLARTIQVRIDVQDAEARISRLRGIADASLRGIPASVAAIDAEFADLAVRIERLGLEDRGRLEPLIQEFIESAKAADPLIAQFEKILRLRRELDGIESEPARIARANERLTIDTAESDRLSRESVLERNAGASTRLIDRIGPSVTALRGQLDGLAEPLRASVGPEVDRLQNKFRLLSRAGVAQSAEEVQKLKGEIAGLNAALDSRRGIGQGFLQSFGGAGTAGLSLGVDERSLRAIGGQIEFVQNRLSLLGSEARGPVLAAMEALRLRASALFQGGALDTDEARRELQLLRQELIRTLAAAGGGSVGSIEAGLKRAGDVGRLGADKLQLGLQQAAFALDDFFSVTGDLQQRVRAIGNNITQLGFIIGGTTGLWVSLSAVLGLQVVAAFLKARNGGKELEDQTRSLTNALQEQKRALDAVLQSFDQVAGDIADRGLTEATKRAEELSKRLREIAREQENLQRSRLVELDPEVQERRSNQATLQRRLEQSRRPAERVALQSLINRERRLELEAADRAFAGRGDGGAEFARRQAEQITSILERQRYFQILDQEGASFSSPAAVRRRAAEQAGLTFAGVDFSDRGAVRAAAVRERERLAELATRPGDLIGNALAFTDQAAFPEAQEAVGALELFIRRLDATDQIEELTQSVVRAANTVDSSLPNTLTLLEQAAEGNVIGSRASIQAIESLSLDLQRQVELAKDAFRRFTEGDEAAAKAAQAARDRAAAIVVEIEAEKRKVAAIDSTRRSLETFSAAIDRVSNDLANSIAQEARSLADQARRGANEQRGVLDAGLGGRREDANAARDRAERLAGQAADIERRAAAIRADNIRARGVFLNQAAAGDLGDRAQELVRSRNAAVAVLENRRATEGDRINAQAGLEVINQQLQAIFEQSGLAKNAAEAANELDRLAAAAKQQDDLIQRGRELAQSPAERAGRQLADDLRALRAARDAAPAGGDAAALDGDLAAASQRIIDDALRSTAPAIFALADAVQGAVLQGPSRAALQPTDVSTVEGSRELNRLLRGDDAARNQENLTELRKQSQSLDELVRIAREGGAVVAN